jgi:hypothetical protein
VEKPYNASTSPAPSPASFPAPSPTSSTSPSLSDSDSEVNAAQASHPELFEPGHANALPIHYQYIERVQLTSLRSLAFRTPFVDVRFFAHLGFIDLCNILAMHYQCIGSVLPCRPSSVEQKDEEFLGLPSGPW